MDYAIGSETYGWTVIDRVRGDGTKIALRHTCGFVRFAKVRALRAGLVPRCDSAACKKPVARDARKRAGRKPALRTQVLTSTWKWMIRRCHDPSAKDFHRYGGRGITVCDRWLASLSAFTQDMGPKPDRMYQIDRIDGTKGYEPSNCRWVTVAQQQRNKRDVKKHTIDDLTMTAPDWAELRGIPKTVVQDRISRGWDIRDALGPYTPGKRSERNPTMTTASKPRPADVARWVATLAEPFPAGQGRDVIRRYNADCDKALDGLTRYSLDAQGNPKPAAVAS